ncbi:MAG: hypothetical protein LW860_20010 [Xanthomonadaceae bacterium]|nr:hypothetical protein [Xanthomonadaceae bacterium]
MKRTEFSRSLRSALVLVGMVVPVAGAASQPAATASACAVQAPWQVIVLNPAASIESQAFGAQGTQQLRWATAGSSRVAAVWSGSAAAWVSLAPVGAGYSEAFAASEGTQVGRTRFAPDNLDRASLWSGTAASWLDLTPAGAVSSLAIGAGGGEQVGAVRFPGELGQAGLWRGSAASWVNLGAGINGSSIARATNGLQQGGSVDFNGDAFADRASLWSGTAASRVDLHPAGS